MTTHTEPKIGNLQVINCDFRGYNMDGTDPIQYTRNDAGEIIRVDFIMDGWLCFGPTITRETEPDVLQKLAEEYGNQRTNADEERQALLDALTAQAERIKELEAKMVPLEKDAARLDWYEANATHVISVVDTWYSRAGYLLPMTKRKSLRAAIDAAMGITGEPK